MTPTSRLSCTRTYPYRGNAAGTDRRPRQEKKLFQKSRECGGSNPLMIRFTSSGISSSLIWRITGWIGFSIALDSLAGARSLTTDSGNARKAVRSRWCAAPIFLNTVLIAPITKLGAESSAASCALLQTVSGAIRAHRFSLSSTRKCGSSYSVSVRRPLSQTRYLSLHEQEIAASFMRTICFLIYNRRQWSEPARDRTVLGHS